MAIIGGVKRKIGLMIVVSVYQNGVHYQKRSDMKAKIPTEHEDQRDIFSWAAQMEKSRPELRLLKGSLMGANLSKAARGKAKAAGVKKGWPDIQLPVPKWKYHGLFIELKRQDGGKGPSDEQKKTLRLLNKYGNFACVCNGKSAAIRVILQYLEGEL